MVREPQLLARLSRLLAEVAVDIGALAARSAEVSALLEQWGASGSLPRAESTLLAANLHGYYTALETLCERVARQLDEEVPAGPTWHADLLSQMQIEVPGLRPPVLPASVLADLHELRKFRHFFRNAYVMEFAPDLLHQQAERLLRVHPALMATLEAFLTHLRVTIAALAQSS